MNYFTLEKYEALQKVEQAEVAAADAAWEDAVQQYEAYLDTIRPEMPSSVRHLLEGFYLHDADVLSIARQGNAFVVQLQLDVPPNELLTITYHPVVQPHINQSALPPALCSTGTQWLHDEIREVIAADQPNQYVHSILLSNGWEVQVRFRDVQLVTAQPIYPLRDAPLAARSLAAQSA